MIYEVTKNNITKLYFFGSPLFMFVGKEKKAKVTYNNAKFCAEVFVTLIKRS